MAVTTGNVSFIKIQQVPDPPDINIAFFGVAQGAATPETFVLWDARTTDETDFSTWIARSLNLSLLRAALVNKLQVSIYHDDTSSLVTMVELLAG
jgi:hypothetical protein